jgi:DNA-binding transcriptional regulator GbsR (MarR family)
LAAFSPATAAGDSISSPSAALTLVRAEGRAPESVAFETDLVGFFVDAADLLGVPKSVAAIYGICFASADPLSFADIEGRLAISKGSISQGLRVLREVGALQTVSGADSRREYFAPELHLRKLATHWLERRLAKQLESGRGRLRVISKSVPGKNGSAKTLRARVKTLQGWHDQASSVLPLVKTFLKLT